MGIEKEFPLLETDYEEKVNNTPNTSSNDNPKCHEKQTVQMQIVWRNVVIYIYFHVAALYGLYLGFVSAKWPTIAWGKSIYHFLFTNDYFRIVSNC